MIIIRVFFNKNDSHFYFPGFKHGCAQTWPRNSLADESSLVRLRQLGFDGNAVGPGGRSS